MLEQNRTPVWHSRSCSPLLQSQESLRTLAADAEEEEDMRQLAREEAEQGEKDKEGLLRAVLKCILPQDDADQRGCILEVRAGKPLAALSIMLHAPVSFCCASCSALFTVHCR